MQLIEVAPGVDVERDIVPHMKLKPIVRDLHLAHCIPAKQGKRVIRRSLQPQARSAPAPAWRLAS
jgi:acyl CoA:acetate/3-ketoacid CoA transferase